MMGTEINHFTPINKEFGLDALGGLGREEGQFNGRQIQANDAGVPKAAFAEPTKNIGRSVLEFIDSITPKWCWPKARFHRALENFSVKTGQTLGGIFNHGNTGLDKKDIIEGLKGLTKTSQTMVGLGADYNEILNTRLNHNLDKLGLEDITHIKNQMDSPEWSAFKGTLDEKMKDDLLTVETSVNNRWNTMNPKPDSSSGIVNKAVATIETVIENVVEVASVVLNSFKDSFASIKHKVLEHFAPIEDRLQKANENLDGLVGDAVDDLEILRKNLSELKLSDPDLSMEEINRLIDDVFDKYDDANLGKSIGFVTGEIHEMISNKAGSLVLCKREDISAVEHEMVKAKDKITTLTSLYMDVHMQADSLKHGISMARLGSALEGLPTGSPFIDLKSKLVSVLERGKAISSEMAKPNANQGVTHTQVENQLKAISSIQSELFWNESLSKEDKGLFTKLLDTYKEQLDSANISKSDSERRSEWEEKVSKEHGELKGISQTLGRLDKINSKISMAERLHVCQLNRAHGLSLAAGKSALEFMGLSQTDSGYDFDRNLTKLGNQCMDHTLKALRAIDIEIVNLTLEPKGPDDQKTADISTAMAHLIEIRSHCISLANDVANSTRGLNIEFKGVDPKINDYFKAMQDVATEMGQIKNKKTTSNAILTKFKFAVTSSRQSAKTEFETFFETAKVKKGGAFGSKGTWESRHPGVGKSASLFINTAKGLSSSEQLCDRIQEYLRGGEKGYASLEIHDTQIDLGGTVNLLITKNKQTLGKTNLAQDLKWIQLPAPQIAGNTAYQNMTLTDPDQQLNHDFGVNRLNQRFNGFTVQEYANAYTEISGFINGTLR